MQINSAQIALVLPCLIAAWSDVRYRRLPNWLSAVTLLAGLGMAVWQGGSSVLGSHLLHVAAALLVGIGLFAVRMIGAGDAKFYAGVAAWFGLGDAVRLLMCVSISGLVLFLGWFLLRRLARKPISRPGGDPAGMFPYGLAVGVGACVAAIM